MDESILAVVFALGGLGRLAFGDALAGAPLPGYALQAGHVWFDEEARGAEAFALRSFGGGPFEPVLGASLTDEGAAWAGAGLRWTLGSDRLWVESAFMPGLYVAGDGPDLGSPVEFRSSLGAVYAFDGGATLALIVDHRSNGDFAALNPGLETIGLRWSWPLD